MRSKYIDLLGEIKTRGLQYNSDTGVFSWVTGRVCGYIMDGYLVISVAGTQYRAHRLAFLIMTGSIPAYVDHINRCRSDNRWCNLRVATKAENCRNASKRKDNTSGIKGVSWNKEKSKYRAYIMLDRKQIHLGFFDTKDAAYIAYKEAAKTYHKNFANY